MALRRRHVDLLSSSTRSLDFSQPGGPLVAVAGLAGGAGASTLAHLVAAAAAAASSAPVLLVETGGPSATLSLLAGAASQMSLVDLARRVEADRPSTEPPFTEVVDGLRLIAAGPQFECEVGESALEVVFGDAQAAHGLTVVDCSTLTAAPDLAALRMATHIVWAVPATGLAADRTSAIFDALELPFTGRELLAIRHEVSCAAVPSTRWTAIAQQRDCDIVLVPHVAAIGEASLEERVAQLSTALQALGGALR